MFLLIKQIPYPILSVKKRSKKAQSLQEGLGVHFGQIRSIIQYNLKSKI
jgi:hypothetical protein